MTTVNSLEQADKASEFAYELESKGNEREAMRLWKAIVFFDEGYDHGRFVERFAVKYDELGDSERADRAYRVAAVIDPGNDVYISNYAHFLYDSKRIREAYSLLTTIAQSGADPISCQAAETVNQIRGEVSPDVLAQWISEPLSVQNIMSASAEDHKRFLQDL